MDPKLIVVVALVGGAAFSRGPFGPSKWKPKPVAVRELKSQVTFPVRVPAHLPAQFSLERAEILWVPSGAPYADIPSRQAVCLWYRVGGEGKVAVVQTTAPRGTTQRTREYLSWLMGGGYFFSNMPTGCILDIPRIHHGPPFALVTVNVSNYDRWMLTNALTTESPAQSLLERLRQKLPNERHRNL